MKKKPADNACKHWFFKCLFGPTNLIALSAFTIGYWWPKTMLAVQPLAQQLELHHLVAMRTFGTEFDSAAYLYWLTFWVTLPFNVAVMFDFSAAFYCLDSYFLFNFLVPMNHPIARAVKQAVC